MSSFSDDPVRKREKDVDSCVFRALCCYEESCSPSCGFRGVSEFFCLRHTVCCEPCGCNNVQPRIVGFESGNRSTDEICKIGLYCCDYSLISPRVCKASTAQILCMKVNCALPCHEDYLHEPVCAYCFVSCYPDCGIAVPPTKPVFFERLANPGFTGYASEAMDRGGDIALTKQPYDPVAINDKEMI